AIEGADASIARPGFLARATFTLEQREGVTLVPATAIVGAAGAEAVFMVEDGKAVRRDIRTGLTSDGRVEVLAGLEPGDTVVVVGGNVLREGVAAGLPVGADVPPGPGTTGRPDDATSTATPGEERRTPGS